MIALLGPPPKVLLAKSKVMSERNWPRPATNDAGELCNNAQEFFDGPFFNTEGGLTTISYVNTNSVQDEFRYGELIPSRSLDDTAPFLEENDLEAFLSFVRQMLTWLPEKRKTARELMDHPFLKLGG
jgi:serine/threonine protein kinase